MVGAISKGPVINGHPQTVRAFASNATLTKGDVVTVLANKLNVTATGERIMGIVKRSATNTTAGVQVNITPYLTFLMDSDASGTALAATDAGSSLFNITGATNAQVVSTTTRSASNVQANARQLVCLEFNPNGAGTTIGLFSVTGAFRQI